MILQLVNRARANPPAEGLRLGRTDFASYPSRPPLAFNPHLLASAQAHNDDMAAHNYFNHTGSDGSEPLDRIEAAGYTPIYLIGENIISNFPGPQASYEALLIDDGIANLIHRRNILEYDRTSITDEIGVAYLAASPYLSTQDFGQRQVPLLTGACYVDTNGNGFYDPGEGVAGVAITVDGGAYYAVTSASGGYALPLLAADGTKLNGAFTAHATGSAVGADPLSLAGAATGSNVPMDVVLAGDASKIADIEIAVAETKITLLASGKYKIKGTCLLDNAGNKAAKHVTLGFYLSNSNTPPLPVPADPVAAVLVPVPIILITQDAQGEAILPNIKAAPAGTAASPVSLPAKLAKQNKPGASVALPFVLKLPAATLQSADGLYQYLLIVADPPGNVPESSKANNVAVINLTAP